MRLGLICIILFSLAACQSGGSGSSTSNSTVPLGAEALGVTLGGHLAGKTAYFLDSSINLSDCWMDSIHWTGSEIFYGATAINFTKLLSGVGLEFDPSCTLPAEQVDADFDIYRAVLNNSAWEITHQADLNGSDSDAAISMSADMMAFIKFHSPPSSFDIYLAQRTGDDSWSAPVSFVHNSPCQEDNPEIFANGTKMIFESSRTVGDGSVCDANSDNKYLWFTKFESGAWTLPTALTGAPSINVKNTQPWVDEENNYLYWTADKECACVRRVSWINDAVVGSYEDILTPSIGELSSPFTANGKIVFLGEYSEADDYVFFSCGLASLEGDGTNPDLFDGRWSINIRLCVIPKN